MSGNNVSLNQAVFPTAIVVFTTHATYDFRLDGAQRSRCPDTEYRRR